MTAKPVILTDLIAVAQRQGFEDEAILAAATELLQAGAFTVDPKTGAWIAKHQNPRVIREE